MVAPWIAPVAKSALSIWQVIATVATSIAVPPLAPVVSGIFTIAGTALDAGLKGASQAETMTQEQYVRESLNFALESLDGMNGTLYDMKDSLGEMNGTMLGMKVKLENVNDALKELNGSMIGIQQFLKETAEENRMTLRDIQLILKSFEENMNRNFDELKLFTIEKDFIDKIQLPMKRLWDLMQTASDMQTKDSVDRFIMQYKQNPARSILADFIDRLGFTHTNPISSAMETHVFDSRFIMDHYVQFLSQLIFKVLAVEGLYFGVAELPNNTYPVYIDGLSHEIDKSLLAFRKFYTSYKIPTEKYWPVAVNQTIISNNDVSNVNEVADKIKNKLDGIYTTDVFSVFVYRCSILPCDFPFFRKNKNEVGDSVKSRLSRFMLGKHNRITEIKATVFRSEKFHEVHAQSLPLLRTGFRSYANLMKRMEPEPCEFDIVINAGNDSLLDVLEETFKPNIVNGFVTCSANSTNMVSRFTNNGTSLLTSDDTDMIPKYYALSWV